MVLAVTVLTFVGGVVSLFVNGPHIISSFAGPQTALLIEADPEPTVVVIRDTTREDARVDLVNKLKAYIQETNDSVAFGTEVSLSAIPQTPKEAFVPEVVPSSPILCDPSAPPLSMSDWGPVNMTITEGVRTISSLETSVSLVPAHMLVLPQTPVMTGMTACLPNGMVALTLTGHVLTRDELFTSQATGIVGYAIDGFPLFGSYEEERQLMIGDLDVCHGHAHTIIDGGIPVDLYHYHMTADSPYTLGCFRGTPVFD